MINERINSLDVSKIKRLENRKVIFLDLNIWIDLVESQEEIIQETKQLLLESVKQGKVFCPLSFPIILELQKQNYDSAIRIGKLMEELSLNICYKNRDELIKYEILLFILCLCHKKKPPLFNPIYYIYTSFPFFCSSSASIEFSEKTNINIRKEITHLVNDSLLKITVTDYINSMKSHFPNNSIKKHNYQEICKEKKLFTRGSKLKNRKIEEIFISKEYILPVLQSLPLKTQECLIEHFKELPKDSFGSISKAFIEELPILNSFVEIMHITSLDDNRKDNANDFFDIEIMILALTYADIFISKDKWITHMFANEIKLKSFSKGKYISDYGMLKDYLLRL